MRPQTPFLAFQQEPEIDNIGKDAEHRTVEYMVIGMIVFTKKKNQLGQTKYDTEISNL
jgi:hypothetical protein